MSLLAWATEVLIGAALFCIAAFVILFRANFTWLRAMGELVKLLIRIKRHTKRVLRTSSGDGRYGASKDGFSAWTVVDMFQEAFAARPNQAMIIMADTGEVATYADIDVRSNRFARWLLHPRDQQGLGFPPGTTVALLMPNCIDYVAVWLGVAKAKGTTALVNTNLTGASLVHAIKTALAGTNRKLLVTSPEVAATSLSGETLAQLKADIGGELEVFVLSAPEALATGGWYFFVLISTPACALCSTYTYINAPSRALCHRWATSELIRIVGQRSPRSIHRGFRGKSNCQ